MGHPWPSAANPASCRVTPAPKPAFGQRGLTGRLRSRSKARARRPSSRPEWLDQKHSRGGLTADLTFEAELNQMWELACLRWHQLVVPDTPRCLHRRQASSHRKAEHSGLAAELGLIVGAGLLAKAVYQPAHVSLTHRIREQARSHILDLSTPNRCAFAVLLLLPLRSATRPPCCRF